MSLSLVEIRYLAALAEARSFVRAAQACAVSQPALSLAIKQLEQRLGVQLFERSRAGIIVTSAALPLVRQAQKILEPLDQIKRLAQNQGQPWPEQLKLASLPSLTPYLLPSLLQQLRQLAPQCQLQLGEADPGELLHQVQAAQLDAALLPADSWRLAALPKGLLSLTLAQEPLLLLLPTKHPWGQQTPDFPPPTAPLLYCLAEDQQPLQPLCGQQLLQPCFSSEALRQLVAAGAGLGLCPMIAARAAHSDPKILSYRAFARGTPNRELVLVWRNSYPQPQLIDLLAALLRTSLEWLLNLHP